MSGPSEVIVAGHSHIFAMGAPRSYKGPITKTPFECQSGRGCFLTEEWTGKRSDAYWDTLVSTAFSRPVMLVYNGNQHHATFLLASEPLWDFVDDVDSAIAPGAVAVSRRLVKAFFERTVAELRSIIARLRAAGCRRIVVLGTPPPKADIAGFADAIRRSPYFEQVAERRGIDLRTVKITPARILLKMWRAIQELMEEIAQEGRALFVPVPPEALDPSGFLGKDFYVGPDRGGDITHANQKYGRLMLEAGVARLGEARRG